MEWISVEDRVPKENEYVIIHIDGYIGISRFMDGEWDVGGGRRRPMFNKSERITSKLEATHWMPMPELPN
jgi:hypothetical protein